MDKLDRLLIELTQAGLPLTPTPYADLAERLGMDEAQVLQRLSQLKAQGILRRIGLVPNHYRLGYQANAMSVWDVDDDQALILGEQLGHLGFVSHCYLRPRHLPLWPYNLFAMLHGHSYAEVEQLAEQIATLLGGYCQGHELLYSTRILKKTGMRLRPSTGLLSLDRSA
ncbi:siroheme decarboxylase subunit beta [Balneatrix alpica]|uniref:siroheme decarboxylase n=1 Tax=Balneatrix alpica TaxID=75684 RepID=A0ABV5ZCI5_9GAMM|nr:AsnC family transcriptional regulator [Balneatrix alpica]